MHSKIRTILAAILSGLVFTAYALAQGGLARITGTVSDSTRAIVSGAQVTIRNLDTNVTVKTETNNAGVYYVPSLPPGPFQLTVEKEGFSRQVIDNIPLTVNLTATFDVTLQVGSVSQAVDVQATSVQLEVQSAGLGKVVEQRDVQELPLAGRNPLTLASLAPGVIPTGGGLVVSAQSAKIAGGLAPMNAIITDGMDTKGTAAAAVGTTYTLPIDAVQEVRVETSNFSAEYGKSLGGIVNTVTKSGTNSFHGAASDFLQNDVLNANSWSNDRNSVDKGKVRFNRFGGDIGGPIRKDKTFFFFAYEGTRNPSASNILATVPTDAQKRGDFSQTLDGKGNPTIIYDPATTRANPNAAGQYIRDPFPGNIIPAGRINPVSRNILPYWPEENRPGQGPANLLNFFTPGSNATNSDNYFTRVDHVINDKHRLYGRMGAYQYSSGRTAGQVNEAFPDSSVTNTLPGRTAMFALSSNFSPTLLGELRVGYTRLGNKKLPQELGFDVGKLGFPKNVLNMVTVPEFPQITVSDVAALGQSSGAGLWNINQDTWQAQYHLTAILGRHTLKFGADLELARLATYGGNVAPAGQYGFSREYTQGPNPAQATTFGGFGLASFLLGAPNSGALTVNPPALMLYHRYYDGYFQDDWRVTDKLSVNLGMRYEYTSPWAEKFGQIGYFDQSATEPATGATGMFRFVAPGGYQSDPEYLHFEPRIGLAYRVAQNTVLRAGASMLYGFQNGVSYTVGDFGTGILVNTPVNLGPNNPIPYTPPVGGSWSNNPFAAGFVIPNRSGDFVGNSLYTDFLSRKLAYLTTWNFNIQQMVTPTLLAEAAYVGSKGTHIYWNANVNQDDPILLSLGSQLVSQVPNAFYGKITSGALSYKTISLAQALRPYPQYLDVSMFRNPYGNSSYQSAMFRVEKRYSKGITLSFAYTISKMIDSAPEAQVFAQAPSNCCQSSENVVF